MNIMMVNCGDKIRDVIASDFRTAPVFLSYQIDLLIDGDKAIEAVCKDKIINLQNLLNDLNDTLTDACNSSYDYKTWPLKLLADLIMIRHRYVRESLVVIQQFLDSLSYDMGITMLCKDFNISAECLIASLQKQIPVLLSAIKQITSIEDLSVLFNGNAFETAKISIIETADEVSSLKQAFLWTMRQVMEYVSPLNAPVFYEVIQDLLAEFKNDVYKIIDLQDILYLRVISLENELMTDCPN